MSKREFLVEVNITLPKGESLDDWDFVGRTFEDVIEGEEQDGIQKLAEAIERKITAYCTKTNKVVKV